MVVKKSDQIWKRERGQLTERERAAEREIDDDVRVGSKRQLVGRLSISTHPFLLVSLGFVLFCVSLLACANHLVGRKINYLFLSCACL